MRPAVPTAVLVLVSSACLLPLAGAASLADLPACAQPCAFNGAKSASCSSTDYPCICTSKAFWGAVPFCVLTACSPADQDAAVKLASGLCASAGFPINGTVASDIAAALSSDLASLASGLATAAAGVGGAVSSALANASTTITATAMTTASGSATLRPSTVSATASTASATASTTKAASRAAKGEVSVGRFGLVLAALAGIVGVGVLL